MIEYASKAALIDEIDKTARAFIQEFAAVAESDKDLRVAAVERTPQEMIAYQLGWMELIRGWDRDELAGKKVITPAPGYKWNQMGGLYQTFYNARRDESLARLVVKFQDSVAATIAWLDSFTDKELFEPGGRQWASSTPSNWPIWKWVHINTVAPFKSIPQPDPQVEKGEGAGIIAAI